MAKITTGWYNQWTELDWTGLDWTGLGLTVYYINDRKWYDYTKQLNTWFNFNNDAESSPSTAIQLVISRV